MCTVYWMWKLFPTKSKENLLIHPVCMRRYVCGIQDSTVWCVFSMRTSHTFFKDDNCIHAPLDRFECVCVCIATRQLRLKLDFKGKITIYSKENSTCFPVLGLNWNFTWNKYTKYFWFAYHLCPGHCHLIPKVKGFQALVKHLISNKWVNCVSFCVPKWCHRIFRPKMLSHSK